MMVMPLLASSIVSSRTMDGVTQTGHPGPAITSTLSGRRVLKPFLLIVCSCFEV